MADKTKAERKPPSHMQSHAFELISRHGPRTVAMVAHSFTNLGNLIPGETMADQWVIIAKEMAADPRLVVTGENPGIGGDWYGLRPDDEKDKPNASDK